MRTDFTMLNCVLLVFISVAIFGHYALGDSDPEITHLDITKGSKGGETYIHAFGKNLKEDETSAGNKVWLVSWKEEVECDVNNEQSTHHKLNFHTPKMVEGDYSLKVQINGKILHYNKLCLPRKKNCTFKASWTNTPDIQSVVPRAGPPGTVIKVCGKLFTNRTQSTEERSINGREERIKRVYINGNQCHLRINNTDALYGIELNSATQQGCFKCKLGGTFVGHHNVSFIIEKEFGRSIPLTKSLRVMTPDVIAMFETHAVVTAISPSAASTEGGTNLTIEGKHFDETTSPAQVTVGGNPCEVKTLEDGKITCITPMASLKTLYPGNRGFKHELWNGKKFTFQELDKIGSLQASGANYSTQILPSSAFSSPWFPSVTKISGFFVAQVSGIHRFYIKANAWGKLYFSETGLPEDKILVATTTHPNHFPSSPELDLKASTAYYLEAHQSNPTSAGSVRIGVQVYNTTFNAHQTSEARNEHQSVTISSTKRDELQEIVFDPWPFYPRAKTDEVQSVNLTGAGQYQLEIDGLSTVLLDTSEPVPSVQTAIGNLPVVDTGRVSVTGTSTSYKVTFQDDKGQRRKIEIQARSSTLTGGQVTIVTPGRLCFATYGQMNINIRVYFSYVQRSMVKANISIPLTGQSIKSVVVDGWLFRCMNIHDIIVSKLPSGSPVMFLELLAMDLTRLTPHHNYDVFVDDIQVRKDLPFGDDDLQLLHTRRLAVKTHHMVRNVTVKRVNATAFTIRMTGYNCSADFKLIQPYNSQATVAAGTTVFRQSNWPANTTVKARRLTAASPAVSGSFDLSYNGTTIKGVPAKASAYELKQMLQTAGVLGYVTVGRHFTCTGYKWNIYFNDGGGNRPLIKIMNAVLNGLNVTITTKQESNGSMFLQSIPDSMLSTPHSKPQVVVKINGIPSSCDQDSCTFSWETNHTPSVSVISPVKGTKGATVTITGTGFSTDSTNIQVQIGTASCQVESVTETEIRCKLGPGVFGTTVISVTVIGKGKAKGLATFSYESEVTGVTPTEGGIGGGTKLDVIGNGLDAIHVVTIKQSQCTILSSSPDGTKLQCEVPPTDSVESVAVVVKDPKGMTIHTTTFKYTTAVAVIASVNVTKACVDGTTPVTFTGTGFGSNPKVTIGSKSARVVSSTDSAVNAVLPSLPPGSYQIKLATSNGEYADLRANNIPPIQYEFEITSCTPNVLSVSGGSLISCTGKGFPTSKESWKVKIGNLGVKVTEVTPTEFKGTLAMTSNTHEITNTGYNTDVRMKHLAWTPKAVEIKLGDCVEWKWSPPTGKGWPKWHVCQTENPVTTTCKQGGFEIKVASLTGSFRKCFDTAGTFFYWSGWVNNGKTVSSYGQVNVAPIPAVGTGDLSVTAAGHTPKFQTRGKRAAATCNPTSTSGTFTFSTSCSPVVSDVMFQQDVDHYRVKVTGMRLLNPGLTATLFLKDIPVPGTPSGQAFEVDYYPTKDLKLCVPYKARYTISAKTRVGSASVTVPDSNTVEFKPSIHSCSPASGSCSGVDLECNGLHLLDAASSSNVAIIRVGGLSCQISDVKINRIRCRTPSLAPGTHNIAVVFRTVCSTPNLSLQFLCATSCTPTITTVTHSFSPLTGIDSISVAGDRLWTTGETVDVFVGDGKCTPTTTSATKIDCKLTKRTPGQHNVVVLRHNCGYSAPKQLTMKPTLSSLTLNKGSINGGLLVRATGIGFEKPLLVKLEYGLTSLLATDVNVIDSKSLEFNTPASGTVGAYKVHIYSNSVKSTEDVPFTYDSSDAWTPKLTSVTQSASGTSQLTVSISGQGLHQSCLKNSVKLCHGRNPLKCCVCSITSNTGCNSLLLCSASNCSAGEYEVIVHVDGKGYATKVAGVTVKVNIDVTSISPQEGSLAGGKILTLVGKGFSGLTTVVTICGVACPIVNDANFPSTVNQVSCKVPKTAGTVTKACPVVLQAGYVNAVTATQQFTYNILKTPTVTSISPELGGTAGGTALTIKGEHFSTDATDLTVHIGGSLCAIQPPITDTEIHCTTSSHATSTLETVVITSQKYGLSLGDVKFNYAFYWSASATWPKGTPPKKGEMVVVDKDATMILDADTEILKMILVKGGRLIVSDTKDIKLNFENMFITDGGLFQIGTEKNPFQHNIVMTATGHLLSTELPLYGSKSIGLRNGTLDIHGKPISTTWTRLEATVQKGATSLQVGHNVADWPVGAEIVITTTSGRHSQEETEKRKITAVTNGGGGIGNIITLDKPLDYKHLGETMTVQRTKVQIKAEVGLLSRNVVFRGSNDVRWNQKIKKCPQGFDTGEFVTQTCFQGRHGEEMGSDQFGAHILIHAPEPSQGCVTARISHTELYYVGQAFRLGRYPIHFHLNGDQPGSYVKGCSIHKAFNRAVNIHGTNYIEVKSNVLYDVMGGAFFLEDGIEIGNSFDGNLGVFIRSSTSLLNEDVTPAFIWMTNANNTVQHNSVAGGTHFGYWYRLNMHPDGPSFDPNICPRNTPLGIFNNNTAHSLGWFGLWLFPAYHPMKGGACNSTVPQVATFENLWTYGCEKGAEWVNAGAIHFKHFVMTSNEKAGIEMKSMKEGAPQYSPDGPMIKDSHVIDHVPGYPTPTGKGAGLKLPFSPGLICDGVTFSNFNLPNRPGLRMARIDGKCTEKCGEWQYYFKRTAWDNSKWKANFEWQHEGCLKDIDGTLTGSIGTTVVPKVGLLDSSVCRDMSDFSGGIVASGCAASVGFHRFALNKPGPSSLLAKTMVLMNEHGNGSSPFKDKRLTHKQGWMAVIPVFDKDKPTSMWFEHSSHITNISYSATLYDLQETDSVIIRHNFTGTPDRFSIIPGQNANSRNNMVTYANNDNGDYFYKNSSKELFYIMSGRGSGSSTGPVSRDIDLKAFTCYFQGCIPPPDPNSVIPSRRDNWFNSSTWTYAPKGWGGKNCGSNFSPCLPKEGDDVNITRGQHVYINSKDGALPKLGKVFVYGWLEFINELDTDHIHFIATHIIVMGGRMFTNSSHAGHPMKGRLTIELEGNHSTPAVMVKGTPSIGAKVLAVFGTLALHGKPRTNWTKLAVSAKKGDNKLTIAGPHDWQPGDEVVLTSTSYKASETERLKIKSVSGNTLTLTSDLAYDHIATKVTSAKLKSTNKEFEMAAEVGLLSRAINIVGAEYNALTSEAFGARVLIGSAFSSAGISIGSATLSNVGFKNYGQLGFSDSYDPRFGLAFLNTGDVTSSRPSYVRGCSFDTGFSTAIGVFGTNGLPIEDNVVHRPVGTAIYVEGKNNSIRKNLVTQVVWPGHYNGRKEEGNIEWPVGIQVNKANDLTLEENVVAGSDRGGYRVKGESCTATPKYRGNEAHAVLIGTLQLPGDELSDCTYTSGFKIWRAFDFGVYSQTKGSITVSELIVADSNVGILNIVFDPPILNHVCAGKAVTIKDSLILAESGVLNCEDSVDFKNDNNIALSDNARSWTIGGGQIGIAWPAFLTRDNHAPEKPFKGAMSYPALCGRATVKDTMFYGFKKRKCRSTWRRSYVLSTNPAHGDHFFTPTLEGISLDDVDVKSKAFFHRAEKKFINPADCVDMDCDAKKRCFIKDKDCSFLGGASGHCNIIPVAEYEWDGDRARGIGDYRIPKYALQDASGAKQKIADVCPNKGIYRTSACQKMPEWQAYQCTNGLSYAHVVIESMDSDTETRRLSPVALISCTGASGGEFVDLINGPMDHGWCSGYTCQKRISTFWGLIPLGKCYKIFMSSTQPQKLRLRLHDVSTTDSVKLMIFYKTRQRLDVYRGAGRVLVDPTNVKVNEKNEKVYISTGISEPKITDSAGTNLFDRSTQLLTVILKGGEYVQVEIAESIVVDFGIPPMTLAEFYGTNIVKNFALFLGIPASMIHVVGVAGVVTGRRRRSSGHMTITIEISSTGGSQDLSKLSDKIIDQFQKHKLSGTLNCTIHSTTVSPPPPKVGSPMYAAYILKTNARDRRPLPPVGVPNTLMFQGHPVAISEGLPFTTQPWLRFTDSKGIPLDNVGTATTKWTVIAELRSSDPKNSLQGTATATFVDGIAKFTDLQIPQYGNGYIIDFTLTTPTLSEPKRLTSNPLNVPKRQLKLSVLNPLKFSVKGTAFDLKLKVSDGRNETAQLDLNWRDHTWTASINLHPKAKHIGELKGATAGIIDLTTNEIKFSNLSLSSKGSYALVIQLVSKPEGYESKLVLKVQLSDETVHASKKDCKLRFKNDYSAVAGEEEAFCTTLENKMTVEYPKLYFSGCKASEGSIVVTFQAQGSKTDIDDFLKNLSNGLSDYTVLFNGYTLKSDGTLDVDGEIYTTQTPSTTIIIAVVVSVLSVAIVIGISVYCAKKKGKKNKLDLERKRSESSMAGRNLSSPLGDDKISVHMFGGSQTPRYTPPPQYSASLSPVPGGPDSNRLSPVSTISGEIIPPSRHGKNKKAGHMETTATRRLSSNKSPNQLRTSERIPVIE